MDRKRQRELALAGVAILLIAVAAWSMQRATASPDAMGGTAAAIDVKPFAPQSPVPELDLKALDAGRPEPDESTRNPFRYKPRSAPPAPSRSPSEQPHAAAPQSANDPAAPPAPPRIPLKYIGDMTDPKDPERKIAILSDSRGTYWGREGEVVEGRYRIVRIGVESIELAYLDGRGRQTIRQTGQ
jgi:hypothetical protein